MERIATARTRRATPSAVSASHFRRTRRSAWRRSRSRSRSRAVARGSRPRARSCTTRGRATASSESAGHSRLRRSSGGPTAVCDLRRRGRQRRLRADRPGRTRPGAGRHRRRLDHRDGGSRADIRSAAIGRGQRGRSRNRALDERRGRGPLAGHHVGQRDLDLRSVGRRADRDPANESRVFSWLLDESFDDKGNVIVYEYKREDLAGVRVGG